MLTVCALAVLLVVCWLAFALARAAARPDPIDHAYDTLPAGRPDPAPLAVDTTTGSHDRLPIREDIRDMLTAYCEGMWQHTREMP